jgi:large subunit ribosomal protein L25
MEQINLSAQIRAERGKGPSGRLRVAGRIPGIVYGPGVEGAIAVALDMKEIDKTLHTHAGGNVLVNLEIAGDKSRTVMFKDILRHPLKGTVMHVDLLEVNLNETVEIEVPVHLTGKAAGLAFGGIVQHETRTITIECLPSQIPDSIDVDITALNVGQSIHVKDIKFAQGLKAVDDEELTIVSIVSPTEEVAAKTAEEVQAELAKSFAEKEEEKKEE